MICLVDGSKAGLSDLDPKRAVRVGKQNQGKGFLELRRARNETLLGMAKPKRPIAPLPPPVPISESSGKFNLSDAIARAKAHEPSRDNFGPDEATDVDEHEASMTQGDNAWTPMDEAMPPYGDDQAAFEAFYEDNYGSWDEAETYDSPPDELSEEEIIDITNDPVSEIQPSSSMEFLPRQNREPKKFTKLRTGHTFHPRLATPSVLDEDWTNLYENCPVYKLIWNEIHEDPDDWPPGVKLFNGKMYREEKLCIPTGLALRIVGAQHIFGGHMGVEKLVRSLRLRYEFAETTSLWKMAKEIKTMCNTCQACEHPNWKIAGKIEMTPIPPKIMTSVSMDLFSPP